MKRLIIKSKAHTIVVIMLAILTLISSCKKDKESPDNINPSLVGQWSTTEDIGTRNWRVTTYELNANGKGKETITQIIGSTNNLVSEENLVWSTEGNNILKIKVDGFPEDVYQYKIYLEGIITYLDLKFPNDDISITYSKSRDK